MADYFTKLRERRDTAILLVVRQVSFRDGSAPLPGRCHENVDRWVAENKGAEAVRGWLAMDYGLERHSVVREADQLIDITLSVPYRFLLHEGPEADFEQAGEMGFNQVMWSQIGGEA